MISKILENLSLTKQINSIRSEEFPELKWVFVSGIYVPLEKLANEGSGGRIIFDGYISHSKVEGHNPLKFGYGFLTLPDYLASKDNDNPRKGIIAHELSHLICTETNSELAADEEAVKRGLGPSLYDALRIRESLGIRRNTGYNSSQVLQMLSK